MLCLRRVSRRGAALAAAGLALSLSPAAQAPAYDLLLRNGRIVDGTGSVWYRGDVAITGDTIAAVGPSLPGTARTVVEADGRVIAPGFIDIHTHAARGIAAVPTAENYVRQGVTTIVEGPDGSSPVPLGPWLETLAALPRSVNIGSFLGQGSVRAAVMGAVDRAPRAGELERMRALVRQGMAEGAFGLSSGLFYVPGAFARTDEIVELARVAGASGGIYISHMRDEAGGVVDSVRETVAIGERGGLPTQVTHHKVIGQPYWGRTANTLRLVDEARARGVDATVDVYPYTASSTGIRAALVPVWAQEGGRDRLLERLADPATRTRIEADTIRLLRNERGGGNPANVVIARCEPEPALAGRTLADLARMRAGEVTLAHAARAALWLVERGECQGIFHAIGEEDLVRVLRHPAAMIASDGEVTRPGPDHPHPRSYGTFARVLAVYVRDRGVLSLEEAVRKMSAFPAQRLGLGDRGVLRAGLKADVVVFDPARIRDAATFERPHQYAEGVTHVVTNGQLVLQDGAITDARPGRVLYGPGRSSPRSGTDPSSSGGTGHHPPRPARP